jgi:hypothetical protein
MSESFRALRLGSVSGSDADAQLRTPQSQLPQSKVDKNSPGMPSSLLAVDNPKYSQSTRPTLRRESINIFPGHRSAIPRQGSTVPFFGSASLTRSVSNSALAMPAVMSTFFVTGNKRVCLGSMTRVSEEGYCVIGWVAGSSKEFGQKCA